jgi:hypothetical protein
MVDKEFIKLVFVSTLDNPANLLTIALQPVKFNRFRAKYSLEDGPG